MAIPIKPNPQAQQTGETRLRLALPLHLNRWMWFAIAGIFAVQTGVLRLEGRRWWCACGGLNPWSGDTHSMHNSQHVFDPYSFCHVSHGLLFCGLFAWLLPSFAAGWRLVAAIGLEVLWEMVENSSFVIDRYRAATVSLDYYGDTVANSLGDVLSCVIGFVLARYLGFWRSIALLCLLELLLLFWIRDNLTLNVIMLIHPIDAIRAWQNCAVRLGLSGPAIISVNRRWRSKCPT